MLPLGLSMLWETTEPGAALEWRFGFDGLDAVTDWTSKALDTTWGITVTACSRMVISGHNAILWVASDRGDLVVKWSRAREHFPSLDASTRLLRGLADQGIPVAAPLATSDGLDRVVLDGPSGELSVTVLPELPGDWLDVTDRAAVLSAGACLAELHQALGSLGAVGAFEAGPREPAGAPAREPAGELADEPVDEPVDEPARELPEATTDEPTSPRAGGLTETIGDWLANGDHRLAPEASRRLRDLLSEAPELDDEPQLVHNDFRAANILTRDSKIVGVLDLDDVAVEHRVHDLAKASVYLGTRFTAWQPTSDAVRQALRTGYESVRPLSPAEARWFEILVVWQGLHAVPGENDPAGWASAV